MSRKLRKIFNKVMKNRYKSLEFKLKRRMKKSKRKSNKRKKRRIIWKNLTLRRTGSEIIQKVKWPKLKLNKVNKDRYYSTRSLKLTLFQFPTKSIFNLKSSPISSPKRNSTLKFSSLSKALKQLRKKFQRKKRKKSVQLKRNSLINKLHQIRKKLKPFIIRVKILN